LSQASRVIRRDASTKPVTVAVCHSKINKFLIILTVESFPGIVKPERTWWVYEGAKAEDLGGPGEVSDLGELLPPDQPMAYANAPEYYG